MVIGDERTQSRQPVGEALLSLHQVTFVVVHVRLCIGGDLEDITAVLGIDAVGVIEQPRAELGHGRDQLLGQLLCERL